MYVKSLPLSIPVILIIPIITSLKLSTLWGISGLISITFLGIPFLLLAFFLVGLLILGLIILDLGGDILIEKEVDHDVPFLEFAEFASEDHDLSGQHPVDAGDGFGDSVVAGDSDVNELKGRIRVTKTDSRNINVGGLNNSLGIVTGVGNDKESWFTEFLSVLIRQGSWGPAGGGSGDGTCVVGVLDDGPLAVWSGRDSDDITPVLDRDDNPSSKLDLLPSLLEVNDMDTLTGLGVDVWLHSVCEILGTDVHLEGKRRRW